MSNQLKLYKTINCPFCQRVKFAMITLGVADTEVEVDLISGQQNEEWFKKINPLSTVPAVVFPDGSVSCDSLPIVQKLDGEHGNILSSRNGPNYQAAFEIAQNQLNKSFFAFFNLWRVAEDKEGEPIKEAEAAFKSVLIALAKEYKYENSYFFGSKDEPSLFDVLFISFLFQINNTYRLILKKELFTSSNNEEKAILENFKTYFSFTSSNPKFQSITTKLSNLPTEGQNIYLKEKGITSLEQFNYDDLFRCIFAKKFHLTL